MKSLVLFVALAAASVVGTEKPPIAEKKAEMWTEVIAYTPSEPLLRPDPNAGAAGADAVGFRVGPCQGGMIIDRLERKRLGVFVSLFSDKPERGDLRVEFSDTQGTKHLTMPDAGGGGSCLLFLSPPSMETKSIAGIRVMYDANAKWLK